MSSMIREFQRIFERFSEVYIRLYFTQYKVILQNVPSTYLHLIKEPSRYFCTNTPFICIFVTFTSKINYCTMINIALFGPPGAGKGTQSKWLIPHLELIHIAPGDILRENVRLQTKIGKIVHYYIDNGQLVPNELVIKAVTDKMARYPEAKGFLFDGYPRTRLQAEALDKQLASQERILDLVLFLQVPQKESYERIKNRRKELFRADDQSDEKIATRFHYYYHNTLPVSEYYSGQEKLIHIPGESNILTVRAYIHEQLEDYLDKKSQP